MKSSVDISVDNIEDFSSWRADFPMLRQSMNGKPLVYLDSAASAQKPQVVIDAMREVLETSYSNVHRGLYALSQKLTARCEAARGKVSDFIGSRQNEIVFTANATAAINLVARSRGAGALKSGDDIILSAMEHHANIVPWQMLRDSIGIVLKIIPIDTRGELDLDAYRALLSPRTRLVAVTHISNVLGTVNPVAGIIKIAKAYNPEILTLIDGSQGVVHSPVDIKGIDADFYVFTGHKLYGPTGIGVLYGKYDLLESMPPFLGGGDMIESVSWEKSTYREPPYRFEAGTPPIVEIVGLGAAIDYVRSCGVENLVSHEKSLISYMQERLAQITGLVLHGNAPERAGIFSFTMENAPPADIAMILDRMGIAIRAGHHCCMPLMKTLGVSGTARASLGLYSSREDIDRLIEGLEKVRDLTG